MPAKSTKKATAKKQAAKPASEKKTTQPKAGAKGKPAASSPKTPTPAEASTPRRDDSNEVCVFAFRLLRSERDEIHAAAGSAKASRFVRGLVLAGARNDMAAVKKIIAGASTPE